MIGIFFGVVWRLLLLLLLLLGGTLAFIGGSETGLRGTLTLVDRVLPGAIRYQSLQGALIDDLNINGLQVRFGEFELDVEQFSLAWQAPELLTGHLLIKHLRTERIRMVLPPSEAPPPPENTEPLQLPDIALPLKLTLQELRISELNIDHLPFVLNELEVALHTEQNTLKLDRLNIAIPQLQAKASGQLTPLEAYPLALDLDWAFEHPQWGELTGQGQISGELDGVLVLQHRLDGAATATLDAQLEQLLLDPTWTIALQANSPDFGAFLPDLSKHPAQLELHSQGTLNGFSANGNAGLSAPEIGPVEAQFELDGTTKQLHITNLHLLADEHPLSFKLKADVDLSTQTIAAQGDWRALAWPLSGPAQIASPQGNLQVSGTLDNFQAALQAALQGEQLGELEVNLSASGSTQELRELQLNLSEPQGELALDLTGAARFSDLAFDAKADWQHLRWPLTQAAQVLSPSGSMTAQGTLDAYQANLSATVDGPQFSLLDARIDLSGDRQNLQLNPLQIKARESDLQLSAQAELALTTLDFTASGEWQALHWPMQGPAEYASEQGQFEAEGNVQDYRFILTSDVGGAALPSGAWRLQGQGSASELSELQITGNTLEGELNGTVQARWQPLLDWQATLAGKNINPGVKWPDVPGKLNFELSSQGQLKDGQIEAGAQLNQLQGQLSGQAVRGEADLKLLGSALSINTLNLQAGQARLSASGALAEQWNVDWQLTVPELRGLIPNASGRFQGQGQLRGNLQQPRAQAQLSGRQLRLNDIQLDRLDGQAQLDLNGRSDLQLGIQQLSAAGQRWESIELNGSGSLQQHNLDLRATGDLGDYQLALTGGLEGQNWQGQLSQLALQETPGGTWRLAQATRLQAGPQQAELAKICLASQPSELCLQGTWSASQGGQLSVQLDQLDLNRFAAFLPETLRVSNTLDGELEGRLSPSGAINGKADIQLSQGDITVLVNGEPVKIAIQGGSISGQSDGASAESKIALDLGTIGQLSSDLAVRNLAQTPTLQANLQAEINDFSIVSKLTPEVQDLDGTLSADIQVSGTLPRPDIQGELILRDAAVSIPQTGTQIEGIQIQTTTSREGRLQFKGSARSGEGELNLEGTLSPFDQQAEVTIKGDQFEALDTFSQMIISPDMQIVVADGQIRINGELHIPSAQLGPPDSGGRSRVSASSDVVIIEDDAEPDSANKTELYAKLRVIMGDDVWVNTNVFNAQLKGDLQVEQTPQLAPRGSGTVEVVSGTYKIYGQALNIERGRILFSGGPITNPGLDLRISRVFGEETDLDQTTVGAQVVGSLNSPELQLFSIPPMLESNIVSYLVFGRPSSGSSDENQLLYQAAAALGAGQGNKLTKGLSEGLGVDLSLNTGSSLEDTELVIGKYLSPELYVSYGVGLFEAVNTFNLRYQFTKWLTLHAASSGSDNSADLLYTIER